MLMLNQLRWLGPVRRMDGDRIPKQLLNGQLKSCKRNPGDHMRIYQDVIQILGRFSIEPDGLEEYDSAGVRMFTEQLLCGRERKRAVRKETIDAIGCGDMTAWRLNVCDRGCAGRLGLVGYLRTHSTLSAE